MCGWAELGAASLPRLRVVRNTQVRVAEHQRPSCPGAAEAGQHSTQLELQRWLVCREVMCWWGCPGHGQLSRALSCPRVSRRAQPQLKALLGWG